MMRKPVDLSMTLLDTIVLLSEGNPGALRVLADLAREDHGFMRVLDVDDMNMRGPQIWVAFKDHCKQDMKTFSKALQDRDASMVATVNAICTDAERAVTGGGSF